MIFDNFLRNLRVSRNMSKIRGRINEIDILKRRIVDLKFDTLEKMVKLQNDANCISDLIKEIFGENCNKLKEEIEHQVLKTKWAVKEAYKSEQILESGLKILRRRDDLYSEIIAQEKVGHDVSKLKEQLKSFDWILEEIKHED